ncbi:CHAT domain-containing protein, partial [Limnofasciculus baicalensis]
ADNIETAIACYQNSLEIRTPAAFPVNHIETSFNLGLAYQEDKRFLEAEKILASAIKTVESLREEILSGDETKQKLAEEYHENYRLMVEISVALGKIPQALTYAERSKTRNLVENILIRDSSNFFPAPVVTQLEELRDKIASGQKLIQTSKKENPQELAANLQQWRQQRNELQDRYLPIGGSFDLQEFQKSLDKNTAILEWYITSDRILTFIITPNRPLPNPLLLGEGTGNLDNSKPPSPLRGGEGGEVSLWQSTPEDLDNLQNWANEYLYIYSENTEEWKNTLTSRLDELAKILHIDDILQREEVKSCQRLILIPHKYLHHFPIHSLPVGMGEEKVNDKYLGDIFPQGVSYAPSCQLLQQLQQRQRPDFKHFFAIQTPTEDLYETDLGIIPAIKREFTTATILKHDNATKANLLNHPQLKTANNLFFFCHGYFNSDSPLDSGLELADDKLTVADIITHLKLENCRLVTLSACESGLPEFANSDEYLSLPYSFLLAGSTNVIATQWRVRSDATALLMLKFYQEFTQVRSKRFSADSTEVPTTNPTDGTEVPTTNPNTDGTEVPTTNPNQDNITVALTSAVSWLRTTTVTDFITWVNQSPLSEAVKIDLRNKFNEIAAENGNDSQPFNEPYFWAGFCSVGK